jgi:hypothetical protein
MTKEFTEEEQDYIANQIAIKATKNKKERKLYAREFKKNYKETGKFIE